MLQEKADSSVNSQGFFFLMKALLLVENPALVLWDPYFQFNAAQFFWQSLGTEDFIWVDYISHRELPHLHHLCHLRTLRVLAPEHGAQSSFCLLSLQPQT